MIVETMIFFNEIFIWNYEFIIRFFSKNISVYWNIWSKINPVDVIEILGADNVHQGSITTKLSTTFINIQLLIISSSGIIYLKPVSKEGFKIVFRIVHFSK